MVYLLKVNDVMGGGRVTVERKLNKRTKKRDGDEVENDTGKIQLGRRKMSEKWLH